MWPPAAILLVLLGGHEVQLQTIRVTAADAAGGRDREMARQLEQALADAGLSTSPPERACRSRCLDVTVQKTAADLFSVSVRSSARRAEAAVRLDPAASPFDQAHALAVQVELLAQRARSARRQPSSPARVDTASVHALASAQDPEAVAPAVGPATPASPPVIVAPPPPAPPAEERLSLSVAGTSLVGTSGDLLMHGAALGLRLRVTSSLDLRATISLLHPQRVSTDGTHLRRELLPLQIAAMFQVPRLPALHIGGGVEALSVAADTQHREMPSAWSLGGVGRVEYRHPIRSFALLASMQAAYHHVSWIAIGDGNPRFVVPPWTLAAALGLEFKVL